MTQTITLHESLHQIDIKANKVVTMPVNSGNDLNDYLRGLMLKILKMPNSKHFKPSSDSTEVVSLITDFMNRKDEVSFDDVSLRVSERLLRVETKTQRRYKGITEMKRGSLIQSVFPSTQDITNFYLIAKVEHESFLNEKDLSKQNGMSYEQKILKTCLIELDDDNNIIDIIVTDSNSTISDYWYDGFLDLIELNTNQYNTKSAFYSIEQLLTRKLKKQAPSDFIELRNNLISYFRTHKDYLHEEMLNNVFGDYRPNILPEDSFQQLKEAVNKLPSNKSFDTHFSIDVKEVKARMKMKISLNNQIELKITDDIEELKSVIHSDYGPDGTRNIIIKTDNEEAFNLFYFKEG